MTNLEQTIIFFLIGEIKNNFSRIKRLSISGLAVYSLAGALSFGYGCGTEDGGNGGRVCDPGIIKTCPCVGGQTGVQTCNSDGTGWKSCEGCSAPQKDVSETPETDAYPGDSKQDETEKICWDKTFGKKSYDEGAKSIQQTNDLGYVVAGAKNLNDVEEYTNYDAWVLKLDSAGTLEWDKTFGGSNFDGADSIQQTSDTGYIVAGFRGLEDVEEMDAWVLKLDSAGTLEWDKTFKGDNIYNEAYSIQQTKDNGYIVAGDSWPPEGGGHTLVLKLDSTGELEWNNKTLGGANSIQQTKDGGYIVAGSSVFKLDSNGNLEWENNTFDGNSIQQTKDGGYIVAGLFTPSVFKLNSTGKLEWDKHFGVSENDQTNSIKQTTDEGYIVAGDIYTNGFSSDVWVFKLGSTGEPKWDKTFGGDGWDYACSIQQTTEGGYIVAGKKDTGESDAWILKLDKEGNMECK